MLAWGSRSISNIQEPRELDYRAPEGSEIKGTSVLWHNVWYIATDYRDGRYLLEAEIGGATVWVHESRLMKRRLSPIEKVKKFIRECMA